MVQARPKCLLDLLTGTPENYSFKNHTSPNNLLPSLISRVRKIALFPLEHRNKCNRSHTQSNLQRKTCGKTRDQSQKGGCLEKGGCLVRRHPILLRPMRDGDCQRWRGRPREHCENENGLHKDKGRHGSL